MYLTLQWVYAKFEDFEKWEGSRDCHGCFFMIIVTCMFM